jgi:MFS family permease
MVLGSVLSVALVGQPRLAAAFSGAIALQGIGLAAPALVPLVLPTIAFFVLSGAGKAILEVAGNSLLQRTVPTAARGQILALLESFVTAALAAGAVTASILVERLGPTGALLAAGSLEVVLVVISWPWVRRVDDAAVVPERELRLLRGVGFFRPLQLTTIEDLAGRLQDVRVTAGSEVVRQGEPGDRFFIVESGRLEAVVDGVPVRELGPGDSFGEIALLRDVPRTATVRATVDATLVSLAQDDFLSAVAGHTDSATAAEAVVTSRIGEARPGAS